MTNCKDSHTTYFPELHAGEEKWTKEELEEVAEDYNREQKEKRIEHQVTKFERLSKFSLDPENKKQYARKAEQWKESIEPQKPIEQQKPIEPQKPIEQQKPIEPQKPIESLMPIENTESILNEWQEKKLEESKEPGKMYELIRDGKIYKVGGTSVVLDHSTKELATANLLVNNFGKDVELVPRVNIPKGVQTPDFRINGEYYDLKTLESNAGDSTIFNRVKKSVKQADNFIIDVTASGLSEDSIQAQVKRIFSQRDTSTVKIIVIINAGKVIGAYKRK